ncbi:MAG: ABC transporter substrate-binding protein, partial [Firmicutes bacterium]|nr:ABC transporter substrate-binding protein [Bacillota bacterium]
MGRIYSKLGIVSLALLMLPPFMTSVLAKEGLQTIRLQLQWKHQFQFAGFYAARERGYFREAGLDVSFAEYRPGMDVTEEVLSGRADIGTSYSSVIQERMEGKPIVLLSSYFKRSPLALVANQNILSPAELKNKKIAGKEGVLKRANLLQMCRKFGLSTDDFTVVPHTFSIDDFIEGKVDAVTVFLTNEIYDLLRRNATFNIMDPGNYGVPFYDVITFASDKFVEAHPKTISGFIEASNKGWAYALDKPEEIVDLILEKYNTQNKSREHLLFE